MHSPQPYDPFMDEVRAAWERDDKRIQEVRALSVGAVLDVALATALQDKEEMWRGASIVRYGALGAVGRMLHLFPDSAEDFARRLVDEVDGEAGVYHSAIECGVHGDGGLSGPQLVLRILTAEPAAIVRAIILALPERER
jgi:hypothetical protein